MKQFEFMVSMDDRVTSEAVKQQVLGALEARYPGHRFSPQADLPEPVVPLVGRPDPDRPGYMLCSFPPKKLIRDVKETYGEIVRSLQDWKPS